MADKRPAYRPDQIERGSQISPVNVVEPQPKTAPPKAPPSNKK